MKLYIETLGCPKNFNDSEGIAGIWERSGMNMTDESGRRRMPFWSTPAVYHDAKKESIDKIFEMADFIEEEDGQAAAEETDAEKKILIVSGCLTRDTEVNCSMKCRKWIFSLESTTMRNCLRS